jgi:hypothetical protein
MAKQQIDQALLNSLSQRFQHFAGVECKDSSPQT